jgi:hypothetical protein
MTATNGKRHVPADEPADRTARGDDDGESTMTVELLLAPGCRNAPAARTLLTNCLHRLGLDQQVRERLGDFASPTILVDGVDVMTGEAGAPRRQACRLDVPTESRVLAALRRRPEPGQNAA